MNYFMMGLKPLALVTLFKPSAEADGNVCHLFSDIDIPGVTASLVVFVYNSRTLLVGWWPGVIIMTA